MEISNDRLVFMLREAKIEGVLEGRASERSVVAEELSLARTKVARDALALMEHAKVEVLLKLKGSKHRQAVGWLLDESFKNLRGLTD